MHDRPSYLPDLFPTLLLAFASRQVPFLGFCSSIFRNIPLANLQVLKKYQVQWSLILQHATAPLNPLILLAWSNLFFSEHLSSSIIIIISQLLCLLSCLSDQNKKFNRTTIFILPIDDTKWLEKWLGHSRHSLKSVELTSTPWILCTGISFVINRTCVILRKYGFLPLSVYKIDFKLPQEINK